MSLLIVANIGKGGKHGFLLRDIGLVVGPQERWVVAGSNGSGKTTLMRIMAGLVQPDAGAVYFKGERVEGPEERLIAGHPAIAYLGQHFELRRNYRVCDELEAHAFVDAAAAAEIHRLCRVGHLLRRMTDELSGGERQRVALARVLLKGPELLLLDEPYSNLDEPHKRLMQRVVEDAVSELGLTVVKVLHDASDILGWGERMIILEEGAVIQQGTPEEVYRRPVSEYAAGLLGPYNLLRGGLLSSDAGGLSDAGGVAMVRPIHVRISAASEGAASGTVAAVRFMGGYHATEVRVGDTVIVSHGAAHGFSAGDTVGVSIVGDAVRFL